MKKFFIVNHTSITIHVYLTKTTSEGIYELTISAHKIKMQKRVICTFILRSDHANEIAQLEGEADYFLIDRIKVKSKDFTDEDGDNILDLESLMN